MPKVATPINRPSWVTVTSTPRASAASSGRTAAGAPARVGLQPGAGPAPMTTKAVYGPHSGLLAVAHHEADDP
ncbi:hypothetical protein ACIA8E_06630 [Streptomyces sp. NPDC051664]|uniref:hypothetical protein n=1 Tax=Streptomyces sp. NPDC051664 TaxID=3365668 RepID=UPI00379AB5BA